MSMKRFLAAILMTTVVLSAAVFAWGGVAAMPKRVLWVNHFALLPGASDITVTYESTNSHVGGGLTALVIMSASEGDTFPTGGNKVVQMAVGVFPLGGLVRVTGVRVCYELTDSRSFITQIRLAQVDSTGTTAPVLLDDGTDQTATGPVCVNTTPAVRIDPNAGSLLLSLRINIGTGGAGTDKIAIRALGLILSGLV
jgi:hypothetical protein